MSYAGYKRDVIEFTAAFTAELYAQGIEDAATVAPPLVKQLLREADTQQRLAVKDCNEGLTEDEQAKGRASERKVCDLLAPYKIVPQFSGDPRGACVKVFFPKMRRGNSFGDPRWYCVPGRED